MLEKLSQPVFFATAHVSQGGCGTQGPVGFGQQGPAPSCFVSATPAPRRQPQVAAGRVGSVEEVMEVPTFWVCSFARLSYKMSSQLSENYLVKYHLYSFMH
jgi:hypothetical protein